MLQYLQRHAAGQAGRRIQDQRQWQMRGDFQARSGDPGQPVAPDELSARLPGAVFCQHLIQLSPVELGVQGGAEIDGQFQIDARMTTGEVAPRCMNRSLIVSPVLPRVSPNPDGGRHAERGHPVEHVAANLCLGPLIGQSPGVKPPADNGLVAIHFGFDQAPAIVA